MSAPNLVRPSPPREGTRRWIPIAAAFLLASIGLPLLAPTASGAIFPACSLGTRLQLYITLNDAEAGSGAFTVAGCTYPFGYAVEIWFRVGSNPGLGDPIAGLPTTADPLIVQSRWTDGHFHRTLTVPANAPDRILVNAMLITPYRAPVGYFYETVFHVLTPSFVPSETSGLVTTKDPGRRVSTAAAAWAPSGSPAGAFTLFGNADASGAHLRVWFEDALNGSSIGGLYSTSAPWEGRLTNTRFRVSFILPSGLPIDFTQPNIAVKVLVLETGTVVTCTIWVHHMV